MTTPTSHAPRPHKVNQNFVVIDVAKNTYTGFSSGKADAAFIPSEPLTKAFIEEFRRNPKAVLDEMEKELLETSTEQSGALTSIAAGCFKEARLADVVKILEDRVEATAATWDKLDKIPLDNLLQTIQGCVQSGYLVDALIGLSYLVYQTEVEETNLAEKLLRDPTLGYPQEPQEASNQQENEVPEPPEVA